MILFDKDFINHPTAIVHNETKNKSFIKLSNVYKKRGIKNHLFLLALHDPSLKDLDVHSPDLTFVQLIAVAKEARDNYWYYLRECVRIEAFGSTIPVRYTANRANIAQAWNFWNYVDTFLILIRQKGKSLTHNVLYNNVINLTGTGASIHVLTKDSKLRQDTVDSIKSLYSLLPAPLKTKPAKDKQNIEVIENTALNNTMKILLAQKSKLAAVNVSRGSSLTITGVDEVAYDYNIKLSLPVMLAAGTAAKKMAKANGQPSGTCLYTTVGYLDSDSGKHAFKIYNGATRWCDEYYDLPDRETLQELVKNNSKGIMDIMLIEFNHSELGMTDQELRDLIRETGATGVQAEVEFLNKWAKGSTSSALSRKIIASIDKSKVEPLHTELLGNNFSINWYEESYKYINTSFVMGLDISELLGQDGGSLVAMNPVTGKIVFTSNVSVANINDFGEFLHEVMKKYSKSILIGERKSVMMAVFDQLLNLFGEDDNIFKRLFNLSVDTRDMNRVIRSNKDALNLYIEEKRGFGYMTAGSGPQSRNALFNKLSEMCELLSVGLRDKLLINQLIKLEKRNNRIDHRTGKDEHDDSVIAVLLCYWFLRNAKNLSYYGLDARSVLTLVESGDLGEDVDKRIKLEQQELAYSKITNLLNELEAETNVLIQNRIKMKINIANREVGLDKPKTLNIQSRLQTIIENKKKANKNIGDNKEESRYLFEDKYKVSKYKL